MQLICAFVFVYAKNWFSHDAAHEFLPLTSIHEDLLSVNDERMFTKYWLAACGRLAQE